ncbi:MULTISPECIES: hypothetical protein [unclassified Bradyrhizobium]|uniref:hypothetical protein n=1 Tax=unclassified Bradyrhizobium TaxID=2631580 RepID=UPI0020B3225D|nr:MULTISPECIES: hypothetical protein [unclassified Bradyrhizobium]MCP3468220.1 hypothetical protein [Bradyrhizobium sp. CCGUVB23]MCP3477679.1 hypothetical protein [Bradyrhizobium sp. CCGUVB1N3]
MFSPATRAQLELGCEVALQLKGKPLAEIANVMEDCLQARDEWLELSRSAVVNADAGEPSHVDESVVAVRKAFDAARLARFDVAEKEVQAVVDKTKDRMARGYLLQQRAEYLQHLDPVKAQETQLAAVSPTWRWSIRSKALVIANLMSQRTGRLQRQSPS